MSSVIIEPEGDSSLIVQFDEGYTIATASGLVELTEQEAVDMALAILEHNSINFVD